MKYLITVLTLVLVGCGGQSNQESSDASSSSTDSQSKSCLTGMTDPAAWLPLSATADLLSLPQNQIKQKVYKDIECSYNWKSDRQYVMKVGNNEIKVDANNKVSISIKNLDTEIEKWLSKSYVKQTEMSYVEYFDQFYGAPMTEEDKEAVNEKLDEKAEKDENFTEQQAKTGKSLLAMAKTENFTEVNDLGDKANYYVQLAPNLRELRLAVLDGNAILNVTVDASDDDAEDFSIAKAVAEAVMAQCN